LFINYNWDSLKSNNYLEYSQYFDRILSFDKTDVENNDRLIYHPLFYSNEFKNCEPNQNLEYDFAFVGMVGLAQGRYDFIKQIKNQLEQKGLNFYKYLYMSRNRYIKTSLFDKRKRYPDINFKKLKLSDISEIYSKSKVIIDYSKSFQSGLTMRTFEALGAGKKLITTNKNIMNEPFYDESFIQVIDPVNPKLNLKFSFENRNIRPNMNAYHIDNWVKIVFDVK